MPPQRSRRGREDAARAHLPPFLPSHAALPKQLPLRLGDPAPKVAALERALAGSDAWITGIRREQAPTRAGAQLIESDEKRGGIPKYNPLADWTEGEVWDYINDHEIPYNPLHDAGYPSIGCTHCTRPPGAAVA